MPNDAQINKYHEDARNNIKKVGEIAEEMREYIGVRDDNTLAILAQQSCAAAVVASNLSVSGRIEELTEYIIARDERVTLAEGYVITLKTLAEDFAGMIRRYIIDQPS